VVEGVRVYTCVCECVFRANVPSYVCHLSDVVNA
jgi:hypothetical protein